MNLAKNYFKTTSVNWKFYWQSKIFRTQIFIGIFFIATILTCFPFFFQYIEQRNGYVINDIILNSITPENVSTPIFILIWSSAFFMLITAIKDPDIFLIFLIAYVILCFARIITISLFPLQTPPGIIVLIDPLSNHFYGTTFITKDLFFSGHASTLFLMYLCQRKVFKKYFILFSCIAVAVLVLVQHIHYFIDVLFAFPFAYVCFKLSEYLTFKAT